MTTEEGLTTDAAPQPRVVLGLDAASTADSMVEWAAQEAIARGGVLQIVTCSGVSCSAATCYGARRGPALIEAVAATRKRHPLLSIEETAVRLCTQNELIDTAVGADLLIVGEPYLGISTRHLLGVDSSGAAVRRSVVPRDCASWTTTPADSPDSRRDRRLECCCDRVGLGCQ